MDSKRKRRVIKRDLLTGKSLTWHIANIPGEWLDEFGYFMPEAWFATLQDEPAPLEDFVFHPNSFAAVVDYTPGYLSTVFDDPRVHKY